jgi:O-antigen ligase
MLDSSKTSAPQLYLRERSTTSDPYLAKIERAVVYAAVFLAPYATFRFSELFFTVSDFLFCVSLILLLVGGRASSKPLEKLTGLWLLAFMFLFLGIMVGSLARGSPERGLIVMAQYVFAYLILMLILMRNDHREIYKLAAIFLISVLVIDMHGIITFYTVGYVSGEGKGVVTGGKRLATMLRNPNLAASINALTLPILLYFWSSGRLKSFIALPAAGLILITVVLTSSNSGLFVTVLTMAVFTAGISTPRLLLRLTFGAAVFIGVFALFGSKEMLPKTFQTRVLGALSSGDISEAGTFTSRTDLMREAIQMISDEAIWFVGVGADQFREKSVQDAPVHNLYLLLWVEGGLLALIGWMMFSGVGFLLWLAVKKAGGDKHAMATVSTTVAALLTIAMSNPHMYARYWTIPVFLSFGLALVGLKRAALRNRG